MEDILTNILKLHLIQELGIPLFVNTHEILLSLLFSIGSFDKFSK